MNYVNCRNIRNNKHVAYNWLYFGYEMNVKFNQFNNKYSPNNIQKRLIKDNGTIKDDSKISVSAYILSVMEIVY